MSQAVVAITQFVLGGHSDQAVSAAMLHLAEYERQTKGLQGMSRSLD